MKRDAWLDLQRKAGNRAVTSLIAIQRDGGHAVAERATSSTQDATAKAIITAAQARSPDLEQRAVNAVWAIINTYYSDKKDTVSGVKFSDEDAQDGLLTTSKGSGAKSTGIISVGTYFVNNTSEAFFARRVLQVGHELEHIQQYRAGLGGEAHRHEREFLAFYHEGSIPAVAGTGRMQHKERVNMFDEAIRHYNAMSDEKKRQYADQYQDLLERRAKEFRKSGWPVTAPPTDAKA